MRNHRELDDYSGPEPAEWNEYLRKRHGDGFMGFQRFRLVHSAYLTEFSAGEWCDWDECLPPALRGRMVAGSTGKELTAESRPESRTVEMRRTSKYMILHDTPGWVLEIWMAPVYFGSREEWNDRVVPGTDLPSLGPYPSSGGYIMIGGPYPEMPTGPFLDRLVEYWELMRDETLSVATDTYVRQRHYEAEERDRLRSEKWNREASAANMTAMMPLLSTSLEAGRARQAAVEHAGITSHYGN